MTKVIKIKHASVAVHGAEACLYLADLITQSEGLVDSPSDVDHDHIDLEISNSDQGLLLSWNKASEKPLKFHLDFAKIANQLRSFPAPKQGAFNQALGKKSKIIIDATGGWGGDSLLMSLQGYEVILIERLPLMATLLADAFERLSKSLSSSLSNSLWAQDNQFIVPKVICGNALQVLQQNSLNADCVYLDPMFPPKRKKSAATNKQMQLLQWLAGPDEDASELAAYAAENFTRLAVKRPDYAEPLLAKPSAQFSSKLVHYDVYL